MDLSELDFFSASDLTLNSKATVHKNGRLGFNSNAASMMKLSIEKYLKIARAPDFQQSGDLYVIVVSKEHDDAFPISKSGGYFYTSTKKLFDLLEYDYSIENKYIYDITKMDFESLDVYKLKQRIKNRDNTNDE